MVCDGRGEDTQEFAIPQHELALLSYVQSN
jgi:hypothetical protein